MSSVSVPVDASDPLVALLAWFLTWALIRTFPEAPQRAIRRKAPLIAFLCAAFLRGVAAYHEAGSTGQPVDALRALAAGGVAVLLHSQVREIQKSREGRGPV